MPRPRLLVVAVALLCLINIRADDAILMPASNPYAPVVAAYTRVSADDLKALKEGQPLSGEATQAFDQLLPTLTAARNVTDLDWGPFTWDGDARKKLAAHRLAPAVLSYAERLEKSDPAIVSRTALDLTALGRNVGRDGALIYWMTQIVTEKRTAEWMAARVPSLSPEAAAQLLKELKALPPGGNLATALATEKVDFLDPIMADIRSVLGEDEKQTEFPGGLRLSGVISEGKEISVGLELASGTTFWLKAGDTRHGVRLISVDARHHDALLTIDERLVHLQLESKRATEITMEKLRERFVRLPENSRLRMMIGDEEKPTAEGLAKLVRLITTLNDFYTDIAAHSQRYRDQKEFDARIAQIPADIRETAAPLSIKVLHAADRVSIQQAQLDAALTARAQGSAPPASVIDPVSGKPMRLTPTLGGYTLESDYTFDGKPVQLTIGQKTDGSKK